MFRYDRPRGPGAKTNAEKHKDLGMLSLVVGHSPGLQALDANSDTWVSVEDDCNLPPGSRARSGGLSATLLTGETLAFLSRGTYKAGVHRVVCEPPAAEGDDPYRFSIVFTLRAAPAPLFTREFESGVVGRFEVGERVEGESSKVLFERIMRSHWNVNAAPGVRDEQRRRFGERRGDAGGEGEGRERASG